MHLVPVPINVRCYSNSNPIVRRSEVTLRAISGSAAVLKIPTHLKRPELSYSAFASEQRADGGKTGAYSSWGVASPCEVHSGQVGVAVCHKSERNRR